MCECGCISVIGLIAYALLFIGGLNWGLVGLFDFDLVAYLFGSGTVVARSVYSLVGIAAIASIIMVIVHYIKKSRV